MGRKRKRHADNVAAAAAGGDAAESGKQPYNSTPPDPPERLLAVTHVGSACAVAFGRTLAVSRAGLPKPVNLKAAAQHAATIRAITFDPKGDWLLSVDDSKTCTLWSTSTWSIAGTFKTVKKPTAAAFTRDGTHVFVADKFGDVTVAAMDNGDAAPLLGHYCSTVAALAVSPDDKYVVSGDRDNKVRVSVLPASPLEGAHEIESYCLGHKSFVTAVVFVEGVNDHVALASAGGDGSVRLWNHLTGEQLAMVQLTEQLPSEASDVAGTVAESRAAAAAEDAAAASQEVAAAVKTTAAAPGPAQTVSAAPADGAAGAGAVTAGLMADPNGYDAAMDAVIDNVPALEGAPRDGAPELTGGAAGGAAAVAAASGGADLGAAAAQATAAAAEANDFAVAADRAHAVAAEQPAATASAPEASGQAAAEAAVLAAQAALEARGGGDGADDLHTAPRHRAILDLACNDSGVLAVAVEGQDDVILLRVQLRTGSNCGRLKATMTHAGSVTLPGVPLPCRVVFDSDGRLWGTGGPLEGPRAGELCVGVAAHKGTRAVDGQQGLQEVYEALELGGAVTPAMPAAAAACHLSDEEAAAAMSARQSAGGQVSEHMKNRQDRYDRQGKVEQQGGRHSLARLEAEATAAAAAAVAPAPNTS